MTATPITEAQAITVGKWRNDCRNALRTGWTTDAQQQRFAKDNFKGYMYWWFEALYSTAAGGLMHINPRVRNAEISLIVSPDYRECGMGTQCVDWILTEAFTGQNLKTVYGEVYYCGAWSFWQGICDKYKAYTTELPNRQYWCGEYHSSMYFSIDKEKINDV